MWIRVRAVIINSITLNNFRQFRGECQINFSTDKYRNVTVVMGDNGTGKTTLLQAFRWCMFNEFKFNVPDLLNKDIERDIMRNGGSAEVSVSLDINYFGEKYTIKRKQRYYIDKGELKHDLPIGIVRVVNNNGDVQDIDRYKITPIISKMMMKSLSEFFFFDGEHLSEMSKELLEKKRSNNFRTAIRGLVGLAALENAVKHFGKGSGRLSTVINTFDKEIDDTGEAQLKDITKEINRLNFLVEAKEKKINSAREAIESFEKVKFDVTLELEKMNDDIERKKKYEQLNKMIKDNEDEINNQIKQLFKLFGNGIGIYYAHCLFNEALEELKTFDMLDKGVPGIHSDTIKFLIKRNICICGEKISDTNSRLKHLNELMMALPPYSIGNSISNFATEIRGVVGAFGDFEEEIESKRKTIELFKKQVNDADDECRQIEDFLADQEKVDSLRKRRVEAENNINVEKKRLNSAIVENIQLRHELDSEIANRNNVINQDRRNVKNKKYRKYAHDIYSVLLEIYEEKENAIRAEFEKTINKIFEDIYDGAIAINISKSYNVSTKVRSNIFGDDELERNTAQNYAIIFAFISSIIMIAKKKDNINRTGTEGVLDESYPLVMDAPLSSFDMRRIRQICTSLPDISEQFILFIKDTDGKLAEEYLHDRIGARYTLLADNPTYSYVEGR